MKGRVSPSPRPGSQLAALAFAGILLIAGTAQAGNGDLPRTPMQHQGERCLTVVDRGVDPVVHLAYTIPLTDTCLTADELPGSRTHQLVGFCHGDPRARILPHWHTRAEADHAAAAGLTDLDPVPPEDVLEDSPGHAGCWHPILPADQRRAITCPAARPGVDWDTRDLPPGTYLVRGYTFEPPLNTWSPRHGLFKVIDDPDPAASPPAVGIANSDTYLWRDQPMTVRLCADAMPGATVTLSYGPNDPAPAWTPFIVDHPVTTGDLDLEFLPPAELAGTVVTLRAEIVDPIGRTYTAFMQGEVNIQITPDPAGTSEPAPPELPADPPYDFCAENPDADQPLDCPELTTSDTSDTGDTSDTSDTAPADGDTGCGCRSADAPATPALAITMTMTLLLLGLRRPAPRSAAVTRHLGYAALMRAALRPSRPVPKARWLALLLTACAPATPADPLDPAEIDAVAKSEGDAVGSDHSGPYLIKLTTTPECDCPEIYGMDLCNNSISSLASTGGQVSLSQTDGFLLITEDMGLLTLSGAIEASGEFDVAAIHGFASALGEVALYVRMTGRFDDTGDFTGEVQSRALGEVEGDAVDCRTEAGLSGVRTPDP